MRLALPKRTLLSRLAVALLLGAVSGFARIPDSVFSHSDTNFRPMWNRTNLDADFWEHTTNWSVLYPGTDSATITATGPRPADTGTQGGWTSLVWAYRAEYNPIDSLNQMDFEVRFTHRMLTPTSSGNSGFNVRSYCHTASASDFTGKCGGAAFNWRISGAQLSLGTAYSWDIYTTGFSYSGAIQPGVDNTSACKTAGHAGNWNNMGIRVRNDTMSTLKFDSDWKNETLCRNAPLFGLMLAANSPGIFSLKYETTSVGPQFRNISIRKLKGSGVTGVRHVSSARIEGLHVERRVLVFNVTSQGTFSVRVTDVSGKIVNTFHGIGPVTDYRVALDRPGLFLIHIVAGGQAHTRKVLVP
jgi:hypothetical protein